MTMITPSYLGETIEYSSLHACRSTLEDPTVAGADPYREDQLGGLSLTIAGLRQRDDLVLGDARRRGVPVAVMFAGGYARNTEDTARIHMNTVLAARDCADRHQR